MKNPPKRLHLPRNIKDSRKNEGSSIYLRIFRMHFFCLYKRKIPHFSLHLSLFQKVRLSKNSGNVNYFLEKPIIRWFKRPRLKLFSFFGCANTKYASASYPPTGDRSCEKVLFNFYVLQSKGLTCPA